MELICRLSDDDRLLLLIGILYETIRRQSRHKSTVIGIFRLIQSHRAPKTAMFSTLKHLLGHDEMTSVGHRVNNAMITLKIKRRKITCLSHLCHGCLSYDSELKCSGCGCISFCFGCVDYGPCMQCDSCGDYA